MLTLVVLGVNYTAAAYRAQNKHYGKVVEGKEGSRCSMRNEEMGLIASLPPVKSYLASKNTTCTIVHTPAEMHN